LGVAAFIATIQVVAIIVVIAAVFIEHFATMMHIYETTGGATEVLAPYITDLYLDSIEKYMGLGMIIGMIVGVTWFFIIRGKKFVTYDMVKVNSKAKIGTLLVLLICVFGVQGFMSLISMMLEPLFNQGGGSLTDVLEESTTSLALSFWGAAYIAVIGPICEELVFRGGVMRKLERYGSNFAIVVSSLLFALYHMILFQAAFAFFIGIILAYTAGRFSLKWAILLHMINNTLAILPLYIQSDVLNVALLLVYIGSFITAGIIILVKSNVFKTQRKTGAPSEPRVYARAFASPWLIIYLVITTSIAFLLLGFF